MPRPARIALGVLAGFIAWFVVATLCNFAVRAAFTGYADVERTTFAFTLPMLLARLATGVASSIAAGLVCAAVPKTEGRAAPILAAILVIFFLPVHYSLWDKFPLWYHAFFLVSLAPFVILGAWLKPQAGDGRVML